MVSERLEGLLKLFGHFDPTSSVVLVGRIIWAVTSSFCSAPHFVKRIFVGAVSLVGLDRYLFLVAAAASIRSIFQRKPDHHFLSTATAAA